MHHYLCPDYLMCHELELHTLGKTHREMKEKEIGGSGENEREREREKERERET
jgi:hypothetical protein